jgi:hypothetical protein
MLYMVVRSACRTVLPRHVPEAPSLQPIFLDPVNYLQDLSMSIFHFVTFHKFLCWKTIS